LDPDAPDPELLLLGAPELAAPDALLEEPEFAELAEFGLLDPDVADTPLEPFAVPESEVFAFGH
jgi:hypothetical protein